MCGVFGFVSYDGQGPDLKRLEKIAAVTERRGEHAFGLAWLDWAGRLQMFKRPGRISQHLDVLALVRNARMVIGHTRWATHGDPRNNLNNHPHPADGGWIVHNGQIRDHRAVAEVNDLYPTTDCDSEVLGLLIGAGEGNYRDRCTEAARTAKGSPFAMLGVWSRPARLIAIRAGNPLSIGECPGGERFYFGSSGEGLPHPEPVADFSGIEFTPKRMVQFDVPRPVVRPAPKVAPRSATGCLFA